MSPWLDHSYMSSRQQRKSHPYEDMEERADATRMRRKVDNVRLMGEQLRALGIAANTFDQFCDDEDAMENRSQCFDKADILLQKLLESIEE